MNEQSWQSIRRFVYERASGCCEYCQTCEANIGQSMHIEHIDPDGGHEIDNLCLSCANCNLSKARVTSATDPDTDQTVPLFNPRSQRWNDHFRWIEGGLLVEGLTPVGRATAARLKMNRERVIVSRRRWIQGGFHPPN